MTNGPPSPVQRLTEQHDRASFACGREPLDEWLQRHALAADRMDSARTFVVCRARRVIGYYSLVMGAVEREEPPARLVRGMPSYPVAMVLLARLAIDVTEQGSGLGPSLLADGLARAVHAGEVVAARLVVVDALDEQAADFYRRFGFVPAPEHPLRLYRRIKDIRASLDKSDGS